MKTKTLINEILVPASGKSTMYGGAWCIVFVTSEKGNFVLKGYMKECEEYIKKLNIKCWATFNMYHSKLDMYYGKGSGNRKMIITYNCDFSIAEPSGTKNGYIKDRYKFTVYQTNGTPKFPKLLLKRLPNKFVNFVL